MQCETCEHEAEAGYRFCKYCKKVQLKLFESSGYLTPRVKTRNYRPYSAREDEKETRKGIDK
jgi:hypothetical protein